MSSVTNRADHDEMPPRIDSRSIGALFIALVAAILGAMPGWTLAFLAWAIPCWLILACTALGTLVLVVQAAVRRDHMALRAERRQLLRLVVTLAIVPWLGRLASGVELMEIRGELLARADASARAGGPRLAVWTEDEEDVPSHGILYDAHREIERPPGLRTAAWSRSEAARLLGTGCSEISHLVGPYYRWSKDCDGF